MPKEADVRASVPRCVRRVETVAEVLHDVRADGRERAAGSNLIYHTVGILNSILTLN